MTLRLYKWGIILMTLLALAGLALVVVFVDPEKSGVIGKILFYLILFFVLNGVFNLLLLSFRKKMMDEEVAVLNVGLSFRQGVLLSLMAVGLLVLQSFRILVWWDGLLVVAGVFLIELYFLSRSR